MLGSLRFFLCALWSGTQPDGNPLHEFRLAAFHYSLADEHEQEEQCAKAHGSGYDEQQGGSALRGVVGLLLCRRAAALLGPAVAAATTVGGGGSPRPVHACWLQLAGAEMPQIP